jgi:hypothetical protein
MFGQVGLPPPLHAFRVPLPERWSVLLVIMLFVPFWLVPQWNAMEPAPALKIMFEVMLLQL